MGYRFQDPDVLFHFPEDFNDEESLQSLPRFCFPYDIERVKDTFAVQHFTFVLTDLEGCQRFGFCRLTSSSQTCFAPMPYLIGIHSSLAERVRSRALEDVVILNVDTNTLESPYEDLKKIPADVVAGLKVRLKRQAASAGSGVAHAFLRAQALLFGGYRDALQSPDEGPVVFCNELFLGHKSQSMREFLESAVHLQCFKEFIDGRLTMLDQGKEPDDVFEEEVLQCGASSGGSKLRRQWVGNLKKGGGALIVTWKTTANKATKYHSKFGLKNLLSSKVSLCSLYCTCFLCSVVQVTSKLLAPPCVQPQYNRFTLLCKYSQSRPRRPTRKQGTSSHQGYEQQTEDDNTTYEDSVTESLEQCSGTSDLQEDDDLSLLADPEEMDLLGEIFDTLSAQSSREPGLLYGTRSLDLFSSDSSEFISHKSLTNPSQESLSPSFGNSGSLMSCEEELEEGPGGEGEEPDVLIDRPENELNQLEKDLTELGENLCSDLQILEDASLDPEVGSQEQQKDSWSKNDGQMNGTMEESLETETVVTERTEMEPDKEELQKEHKTTNDLGPNGPTNEGMTSAVSHNVKIDKREELDKKSIEPLSPNVLPTVALFQSSADSSGSRGWDKSLKTPIRTHKINVGPMTGLQTEEQSMKSPVSSTPEDQTQAPIKVSELKKRFEH
ncbi:DENN domain-containing protein 1C-like [Sinocyclocheilus grahami]|uniref:DENN domain-containing protein 1C-like n=1 Tax=Sinocyclocheilus grahami TaxID=75366 RepID=UPI0007AC6711|nr:PREDICTED: DENN domain-containing protein 1C-like [Sinocyclocheilus grahami]